MWIHKLSEIDKDKKEATCSYCGRVAIYVFKSGNACKNRRREYRKKSYEKSMEGKERKRRIYTKSEFSNATKSAYIKEQKNKPCMDCGISFPYYVMDFDHRDPSQKSANLARMLSHSFSEIIAEIAKCDVVCSNCHRERTYGKKTTPPTK